MLPVRLKQGAARRTKQANAGSGKNPLDGKTAEWQFEKESQIAGRIPIRDATGGFHETRECEGFCATDLLTRENVHAIAASNQKRQGKYKQLVFSQS